jgi:hypothetical protein
MKTIARVRLSVEIEIGTNYDKSWKIEDIMREARTAAINRLERMAAGSKSEIRLVGKPTVEIVVVDEMADR